MPKLHLILPMAGRGSRFFENGFVCPKPLIEIAGKPFFYWAARSIEKYVDCADLTFVVLEEHIRDFAIDAAITSDCAPLADAVKAMFDAVPDRAAIHTIRDATRGGVGTVLHEIAAESHVGIELSAAAIPVAPELRGVCGLLGLEPLYLACEGRLVIFAPQDIAPTLVETLRALPNSQQAAIIGRVTPDFSGRVVLRTEIGTRTLLPEPSGELLPRIC